MGDALQFLEQTREEKAAAEQRLAQQAKELSQAKAGISHLQDEARDLKLQLERSEQSRTAQDESIEVRAVSPLRP